MAPPHHVFSFGFFFFQILFIVNDLIIFFAFFSSEMIGLFYFIRCFPSCLGPPRSLLAPCSRQLAVCFPLFVLFAESLFCQGRPVFFFPLLIERFSPLFLPYAVPRFMPVINAAFRLALTGHLYIFTPAASPCSTHSGIPLS